jgi:hypothetical protein
MVFRDMVRYPYPGWLKSTWILIGDVFEKNWWKNSKRKFSNNLYFSMRWYSKIWFITLTRAGSNHSGYWLKMPLRRIGEKIVKGKNDSSVSTHNFLIIYIFLWDGIPKYGSLPLPGLAQIDLNIDRGCFWEELVKK